MSVKIGVLFILSFFVVQTINARHFYVEDFREDLKPEDPGF